MKNLTAHLTSYAAYHRDARNIATHFVGIPLIMLGIAALLSRPAFDLGGIVLSPWPLLAVLLSVFYLRLDLALGLLMTAIAVSLWWVGAQIAAQSVALWLSAGLGLFALGWVIQFVGHIFEGKKPAFVDDLMGLLQGPLFLVAEVAFALGLRAPLKADIERVVGPVVPNRRLAEQHAR